MRIIELRNYLLQEGVTRDFIRHFEERFLFSQREEGMHALGQFAVEGQPDRFVWIRGFDSLETRARALSAFYGGPCWQAHGPAANEMMREFHHVHLLRPLAPGVGRASLTGGQSLENRAAEPAGALPPDAGVVAVDFYRALPGALGRLVRRFEQRLEPARLLHGRQILGYWIAELAPNDFPRLPVIQDPSLLVTLSAYRDREHYAALRAETAGDGALRAADVETLLLRPTARSLIRYRGLGRPRVSPAAALLMVG
jgi:hypothetical protein